MTKESGGKSQPLTDSKKSRRASQPETHKKEAVPTELENLLTVRIVQLAELVARAAAQVYEVQFGVKNTELRILLLLDREKELWVNELSRRTRVDKGWISRSLDAMVERGIVARAPHASDSRVSLVSLTERGVGLLKKIGPIAMARNARLLEGFDVNDVNRLFDALFARAEEMLDESEPAPEAKPARLRRD